MTHRKLIPTYLMLMYTYERVYIYVGITIPNEVLSFVDRLRDYKQQFCVECKSVQNVTDRIVNCNE